MSDTPIRKKVDESWKEQVQHEKQDPPQAAAGSPPLPAASGGPASPPPAVDEEQGLPGARFDLFLSGLAMDALIALGDVPNPVTRKQSTQLPQARYLIDLLGLLDEKTRGNLTADEERLLKDALYQLRMRYLAKSGG